MAVDLLLMPYSLPPPRYSSTESELAGRIGVCGLPTFTRGLNGRQYTLLQSTDQKGEAGWGDTVRKHSVKLCSGHNLQTSVGSETGGERKGSMYAGVSLGLTY